MSPTASAPALPAAPPVGEAEPGDHGYTVWRALEQGDPALVDAIVAQIACEHFSREP